MATSKHTQQPMASKPAPADSKPIPAEAADLRERAAHRETPRRKKSPAEAKKELSRLAQACCSHLLGEVYKTSGKEPGDLMLDDELPYAIRDAWRVLHHAIENCSIEVVAPAAVVVAKASTDAVFQTFMAKAAAGHAPP